MARILLIDDDQAFAEEVQERLGQCGHQVHWEGIAEEALAHKPGERFDVILLDHKMPRMSGLEFLEETARRGWRVPVILITGEHMDITAIRATNLGAFGYAIKPTDIDEFICEVLPMIKEAVEVTRRPLKVPIPEEPAAEEPAECSVLVGRSRRMLELLQCIGRVARLDETVLIRGETGTGKDLVAQALHTNSPRQAGPFVPMNCSAFNEQLLDAELFGHEPGAFTGAVKLRKGRFEHACGGTLFLDEAGDMPLPLQAKLLRVLENREIVRLGSNDPIRVNVRVLAATHCDLDALVRDGRFRQDLFYRLEGITIHLPPLRERPGDVELLARTFLARLFSSGGTRPVLHPLALERLRGCHWPGNVRQLQKVICRAVGTCRGQYIMPEDIDFGELKRPESVAEDPQAGLRALVEAAWRSGQPRLWDHLHDLLDRELLAFARSQGVSEVELKDRLGKSRNYVRDRLKQLGLKPDTEVD
jgi:DNA-binding NtrC family response regulator